MNGEDIPKALRVIEEISLRAMAAALSAGVPAPRHEWLAERWRAALSAEDTSPEAVEPGPEFEEAYAALGFPPAMAVVHRVTLSRLPDLLADRVTLLDLFDAAELAAYQDNVFTRYLNAAAAHVLSGTHDVLELGGGEGFATATILPAVEGKYLFTDVSRGFTVAAAERYRHRQGFATAVLDMDRDFGDQGVTAASAVFAGNALHNAAHLGRTLRRIRGLLEPGARLVFTESGHENHALLTSMAFLLSAPAGKPRPGTADRRAGAPFLDEPGWRAELAAAGFTLESVLPEPDSPLAVAGQRLFSAVATDEIPAGWSPAKVLAHLERTGAEHAVLSAATLRELPDHPAALLADLPRLRRIESTGWLTDAEADAVRDTFGVEVVRHTAPETRVDVAAAGAAADLALAHIDLAAAVRAVEDFGRTALLSMLNVLSPVLGRPEDEILAITPGHRRLLKRWLDVLKAEGLLTEDHHPVPDPAEYSDEALENAWQRARQAWLDTVGSAGTVDYAMANARKLPELLAGREQAVNLLFPQGRTDLAAALYRENVTGRYQHHAVSALAAGITAGRRARILEVGAGTGATTEHVLPALDDVEYLYTDVSAYFLDQARERLKGDPRVHFGRFDIDVPIADQGFSPESFDLVIGGGVLNAAQDTDASVARLTEILVPGGWLLLTEPTVEEFWILTSQAFLMADAADDRAEDRASFLTLPQWNAVLDRAGLVRADGLPATGHPLEPLGHRVFAARKPPRKED
ncbi:class I SAM-dependent methyltransferase [Amycolatopsis orientalis]|uniref:class I SAM-dependent methyltransferase n=1 Tax=Amycolatopsis orientalis TaxID=31958 RepID=UPI00041247D8|nr:class I SAM-dependent methyltransferase [Amycolatopsis orientalis]